MCLIRSVYRWNNTQRIRGLDNTRTHARTLTHARSHARTHTHTHIHTHIYRSKNAQRILGLENTHTHARARAHTHTHTHARARTHTFTDRRTRSGYLGSKTHTHARARAHTHTHTHARAHTHTHTDRRTRSGYLGSNFGPRKIRCVRVYVCVCAHSISGPLGQWARGTGSVGDSVGEGTRIYTHTHTHRCWTWRSKCCGCCMLASLSPSRSLSLTHIHTRIGAGHGAADVTTAMSLICPHVPNMSLYPLYTHTHRCWTWRSGCYNCYMLVSASAANPVSVYGHRTYKGYKDILGTCGHIRDI